LDEPAAEQRYYLLAPINMRQTIAFGVVCLASLSVFLPVRAQAPSGAAALSGTVLDGREDAISGAKVTIIEKSKDLVRESFSGASGSFLFPSLSPGVYVIRVTKVGFSTYQMDDLKIEVGQQAALDITLQIGEVRTVVTVSSADAEALETTSNVLGTVVDSAQVQELPLNGRNFLQLALLAGGAGDVSPANNIYSPNIGPPDRAIVLPGTLPYSVGYFLNSVPIRGPRDGELALNVSIAAIDQFKVEMNFLMPDQGANAAAVNIVTKSGSNQFHGEAFEFLRNGDLDARGFFALGPEDLKQNQFGFALGGPLWKDRLWFHGFYEGLRQISGFTSAGYDPTSAMFGGDFANLGRVIYDPNSYDPVTGTRQPFPGNTIPSNRINPVAQALAQYYLPGSSLASIPSNVYGNPRNTLNDDQGGLRLDMAVSPRQQLFAQLFHQNSPADQQGLYPFSGLLYANQSDLAMLQHTWSLSPRLVNSLRVAFVRSIATGGNEAQTQGPSLQSIGITNAVADSGVSEIDLQGYSSFGRSNATVGNRDNTWSVGEEFSYAKGRHMFKFGMDLSYRQGWEMNSNSTALGDIQFQPMFTSQLARNTAGQLVPLANTGDSWADFLLGMPASGSVSGLPPIQYRATQFLPFFQDTWRITRNLTLNYGLSWYLETPPNPQGPERNNVHGFDPVTGLVTYAALGQISPQVISTDRNNFAPRLGLAWKPGFLKATVVRAGAGVYYSEFPWFVEQFSLIGSPPFGGGVAFTNPTTNPVPTYVLGNNVFPQQQSSPLTASYAANLPPGIVASSIDPNFRTPYVNQWNLSIQQGVGKSSSVELTYLGSSSHKLVNYTDISQCRPGPDLLCNPATKPWPRYDLLLWIDSNGNSSYEGLVARYQHRMAGGLNLQFAYTFAQALTDTWQSSLNPYTQITSCRSCGKGPATFDVRQRAVASAVWQIPFGRGRRFGTHMSRGADLAAGGWSLTGIATFATGQPIYLTAPNRTGGFLLDQLPDRVCDGRSNNLSGNLRTNGFLWFDPSCFPLAPVGYFGNSGRTVLNGPGINNWDLGLEKSVPLTDQGSVRLQLRGEFFNAWNHTQFEQPDANAGDGVNFGRISAAIPPRLIQVGMKLLW
jgi:Carboxypeptidase regulatory-like domain